MEHSVTVSVDKDGYSDVLTLWQNVCTYVPAIKVTRAAFSP